MSLSLQNICAKSDDLNAVSLYDDIKTIADHRHYVGNQWNDRDRATSDASGGGHAHAGAMIYLGGTWPEKYRGAIFMNNIHGARINMDTLTPSGSGYVGSHGSDFIRTNDLWSQIINLQYGPDGNVYMIDWYDKNQCHRVERDAHDRTNGRIFKVSYVGRERRADGRGPERSGLDAATKLGLRKLREGELVELQLHPNDWYVRHARRLLQERAAAGKLDRDRIVNQLTTIALTDPDETRRLRGLWALHVVGGLSPPTVPAALGLNNESPYVRAWAIRLAAERASVQAAAQREMPRWFAGGGQAASMAFHDPSPIVRLALASAIPRVRPWDYWEIMRGLVDHSQDADDHNLPLMYWYAMEPLVEQDMGRALKLASDAKVPQLLPLTVRRIAAMGNKESMELLVRRLGEASDDTTRLAILGGVNESLKGRRQVEMPAGWLEVSPKLAVSTNALVRQQAAKLAVTFGEARATDAMRKVLSDRQAPLEERRAAIQSLLGAKDPNLAATLQELVADAALRRDALRGLAVYDDPKTADVILGVYPSLSLEEKRDALNTLAARVGTARALVAAVAAKKIPTTDLSADVLRQLRNIKDEQLAEQIAGVWGSLRDTAEDKVREIRRVRGMIAARQAGPDELPLGRAVFAKTCQQCHTLFGTGAKIGPELTGSNRADLEYLLSNVLDPSAVMAKEYQPHLIATTDGRVITGLVLKDDGKKFTVATANDTITLPRSDIEEMKLTDKSMMPDDLLKPLADDEVRALVAYVASPTQVPMLATADNVKSLFNGQDLAGWDGDPELWSVENDEIVGKTASGIKHNEFLRSHLLVEDFKLSLKVKLTPNAANSGIQFRSEIVGVPPSGGVGEEPAKAGTPTRLEMRGPQADIGAGWWGKLYEENGRGLLWDKSGEMHVKPGEWNDYEIIAVGSRIRTFLNGKLCVDLDDPAVARRGVIALQIHSGGPTEVRFRDLKLQINPSIEDRQTR